uniref:Uncharacterized protein n=1 Tax=Arundo donax TaxID=35708 RepID=A0A0A9GW86_ARUDO
MEFTEATLNCSTMPSNLDMHDLHDHRHVPTIKIYLKFSNLFIRHMLLHCSLYFMK